jgi:hypothetical protein
VIVRLFDGGLVTIEDDLTLCASVRLRELSERLLREPLLAPTAA